MSRIINTNVHESTGVSPAALVYGNAFSLDKGIFDDFTPEETQSLTLSQGSAKMLEAQRILLEIALEHQMQRDDTKSVVRAPTDMLSSFPTNSYVLVQYPTTYMGAKQPNKLMTTLRGPCKVVSNIGAQYTVLDLATNDTEIIHE